MSQVLGTTKVVIGELALLLEAKTTAILQDTS
jgi:hypothetical protein